jgi:hypothetical protein
VGDLSIYPGSSLILQAGSLFHADTISWLKGDENDFITISSDAKSSLSSSSHFLLCTDYLNVSNVDFSGSSRIYAGLNSSIVNSSNWQAQTCESALFADFDAKYLCQNGFTEFNNKSIGDVDTFEWTFKNENEVIGSSAFEKPFRSFGAAGTYSVSLTVSNQFTSHTFEREIEISSVSIGMNDIAVSSDNLVSLATSSSYQWFLNEQKIDGAVGRTYAYNGAEGVYRVVTYEGKCNRSSGLVTITGIEENTTQLKIYPNPVGDDLFIEFNSSYPAQATMTDLLGRTINSTFFNGSINIPVVHLTNGIYLLKIKAGGREIVKKIVVNH